MDILAHSLWTNLGRDYLVKKTNKKISRFWSIFFGIFPDLFAFTPIFIWSIFNKVFLHPSEIEPFSHNHLFINQLTYGLYNLSHSLIIFGIVFLIIYLIKRKIYFALFGWPLHILIDIFSHSYQFYPTPFLWPVSNFKVNGISWGNPWFMTINYLALLIFYSVLFLRKNKKI
ncbi:MAG: hypothetical protein ACP5QN_01810 [Minisyncoccia bacterium]